MTKRKEVPQVAETTRVVGDQVFKVRQLPEAKFRRVTINNSTGGGPRFKREYVRK
jgi:hypothetical protein